MVVTSCQSWLCPYETGFSGPATLSISLPSGFKPSLASLNDLMQKTKLREEEEKTIITAASYSLHADSINIHFLYLTPEELCLTLPLTREDNVGNLLPEMEVT